LRRTRSTGPRCFEPGRPNYHNEIPLDCGTDRDGSGWLPVSERVVEGKMRARLTMAATLAGALVAVAGATSSAENADQQTPPAGEPSTFVAILDNQVVQGILGKEVRSTAGESMGRVVDVLVDRNGKARGAVIDFGGFLGVGSRKVVVEWSALHFDPSAKVDRITIDLNRDQVKAAPEYKDGKPVMAVGSLRVPGSREPEF
jgi:hypothetical protein